MKQYFCHSLSSLLTLNFMLDQEESFKDPVEKFNTAIIYMRKIMPSVLRDIDNVDNAKLQEKIVTALNSFNNYHLDLNDKFVNLFLRHNFLMDSIIKPNMENCPLDFLEKCEQSFDSESAD